MRICLRCFELCGNGLEKKYNKIISIYKVIKPWEFQGQGKKMRSSSKLYSFGKKNLIIFFIISSFIYSLILFNLYYPSNYSIWEIERQDEFTQYNEVNFNGRYNVVKLSTTNMSKSQDLILISKSITQASGSVEFWMFVDFSNQSMNNPRVSLRECYLYLKNGTPYFRDIYKRHTQLSTENLIGRWVNYQFRWESPFIIDIYIDFLYTKSVRTKSLNFIQFSLYADGINNQNIYLDYLRSGDISEKPDVSSKWVILSQDNFTYFQIVDMEGREDVLKLSTSKFSENASIISIIKQLYGPSGSLEFWMYIDFISNNTNNPRVLLKNSYLYIQNGIPYFRDISPIFNQLTDYNVTGRWVNYEFRWNSSSYLQIFIDYVPTKVVKISGMNFISFVLYADGENDLSVYIDFIGFI